MKRIFVILALTISLIAPLAAQPMKSLPFAQGAAATKTAIAKPVADIASKVLANGLEVVVLEDHSVPVVTIELAVRNGSFT